MTVPESPTFERSRRFSAIRPALSLLREREDDDDLYPCAQSVDLPPFAARSTGFEVGMEDFMPSRVRRPDKNAGSAQQDDVAVVTTETMLVSQASYTAPATLVALLCGSIQTILAMKEEHHAKDTPGVHRLPIC